MSKFNTSLLSRFRTPVALGLCCTFAAGLFIWFKLRVVTGMPRSAYAVPEQEAPKMPKPAETTKKSTEHSQTPPVAVNEGN